MQQEYFCLLSYLVNDLRTPHTYPLTPWGILTLGLETTEVMDLAILKRNTTSR